MAIMASWLHGFKASRHVTKGLALGPAKHLTTTAWRIRAKVNAMKLRSLARWVELLCSALRRMDIRHRHIHNRTFRRAIV